MITLSKTSHNNQFILSQNDKVYIVVVIGSQAVIFRDLTELNNSFDDISLNNDGSIENLASNVVFSVIDKDFLLNIESLQATYLLEDVLLWHNDPENDYTNFGVDIISPDGFSFFHDGPKKDIVEAEKAFEERLEVYKWQGYYSSNSGRISIEGLKGSCSFCRSEFFEDEEIEEEIED